MKQQKIVLHVVGRMNIGGAESRTMDLYRHIDRKKVQFVFCQHTADRCAFEDEVESLGGVVYHVPRFQVINYFAYKKAWEEFFKMHPEIDVVHGHMTSTAAIYLPIAKKYGVKCTIAHARSAGVDPGLKGRITRFLRRNLWKKCDFCFTCSDEAGESVFGKQAMAEKKVTFIPNAIEIDKFKFNEKVREEIRYGLGLQDKFVIGHVGRFSPVKNHSFLLQILQACIEQEKAGEVAPAVLMLLGDGELKEEIMEKAVEMGISSRVLFLGNKKDVHRYYQAMDYFLLPSFYEGLPGTAIEAQASGLRGMISSTVTSQAVVTELMKQKDIKESAAAWAEEMMQYRKSMSGMQNIDKEETMEYSGLMPDTQNADTDAFLNKETVWHRERSGYADQVKAAGFDVEAQAKRMQEFYLTGTFDI